MAQHINADPTYVMGRTDAEAERLMLQSRILDRGTRRFLADAGIAPGMTVLDVESVAARARAEVEATGYPFIILPMVTAWTRTP